MVTSYSRLWSHWFHDQLNDDVMQDIRNPYFEYFMTDDII